MSEKRLEAQLAEIRERYKQGETVWHLDDIALLLSLLQQPTGERPVTLPGMDGDKPIDEMEIPPRIIAFGIEYERRRLPTSERCGECAECHHDPRAYFNAETGQCVRYNTETEQICGCKCVFPATEAPTEPSLAALAIQAAELLESLCERRAGQIAFALRARVAGTGVGEGTERDELSDECQRRMDAVVEAAVEWRQSGREGDGSWMDKADALGSTIESLLELRDAPATVAEGPRRCPHCSRAMTSDFDPDVGKWYECENCDYREAVSSSPDPVQPLNAPPWIDVRMRLTEEINKWIENRDIQNVAGTEVAALVSGIERIVSPPSTTTTGEGAHNQAFDKIFDKVFACLQSERRRKECSNAALAHCITDYVLAIFPPTEATQADDYVAWCRYVDDGNRIVLCDSDAEGAFKVYRTADAGEVARLRAEVEHWRSQTAVINAQLRAKLSTARADAIRECVGAVKTMRADWFNAWATPGTPNTQQQKHYTADEILEALESLSKGEGDDGPTE